MEQNNCISLRFFTLKITFKHKSNGRYLVDATPLNPNFTNWDKNKHKQINKTNTYLGDYYCC